MNISNNAWEGTPNYPVEVKKGDDGQFHVTTSMMQGKEWVGESVEMAMRSFQQAMNEEYDRLFTETEPQWVKDVKKGEWL